MILMLLLSKICDSLTNNIGGNIQKFGANPTTIENKFAVGQHYLFYENMDLKSLLKWIFFSGH